MAPLLHPASPRARIRVHASEARSARRRTHLRVTTYVVLDEGHRIRNAQTQIMCKSHSTGSMYRLILTGTPVQNNLVELWGFLHWLSSPHILHGPSTTC
ncbi:hypothetical protein BDW22DRAFT_1048424 [Trametopsis cervina]|nr:hypothetical protein BDW22DRAFT_1048424 [Trametopsis cervina]